MACCKASTDEDKANEAIDRDLRDAKKKLENEYKLLLLGAGESGKSTIAKQMKIIHKAGFTQEERVSYKGIIYNNVFFAMRTLITGAEKLGIPVSAKEEAKRIMNAGEENFATPLTPDIAKDIKTLWNDKGIQEAMNQSSKFQLIDSAKYYFDAVERISQPDYIPDDQDVLRSRSKTTGIIEMEFEVQGAIFRMVDVGGQRSERKKWMHCFQDVKAVLFCVALSEYDLVLQEDEQTNRMHESVKLFKEICNSTWFNNTNMILFLNKRDIFEEKIKRVDLNVCFPEYKGGMTYDNASKFIEEKFKAQNDSKTKVVYTKLTCATDTDNVTAVFNYVKDIVLRDMLSTAGF